MMETAKCYSPEGSHLPFWRYFRLLLHVFLTTFIPMADLQVVALCSLVEIELRFRGTYCLYRQRYLIYFLKIIRGNY
jgi:hypothetical protein